MASTLGRREEPGGGGKTASHHHPSQHPPGYTNGGTHIPLGSEGSSKDSELSSGEGQLPETVDIDIILPDKNIKSLTVDYGKQMMDLLVQVTTSVRLSPATHTFVIYSEVTGRPQDYYASQPVGSTGACALHLVEKKSELRKKRERETSALNTFEITRRLTINLPKNQKMITRVSPKSTLADIFKLVCVEKNLDPYKYDLRHPTQPDLALNMASPLKDYQLVEITVVAVGPETRHNISNLSLDLTDLHDNHKTSSSYRASTASSQSSVHSAGHTATTMDKKKKKGIFSIFSKKKEGKFKISEATYNDSTSTLPSNTAPMTGSSHVHSSTSSSVHSSPAKHASNNNNIPAELALNTKEGMVRGGSVGESNNINNKVTQGGQNNNFVPPKPPRKKRQAPPPPPSSMPHSDTANTTTTTTHHISSSSTLQSASVIKKTHSRNSSHSSGFESAGSPIESPGTSRVENSSTQRHLEGEDLHERVEEEVVIAHSSVGDSLRASRAQVDVRPKDVKRGGAANAAAASKKKRRAPAPPGAGASHHHTAVLESAESTGSTTPITTSRDNLHYTHEEQDGDTTTTSNTSSLTRRADPVFMPPPPPDTPPPSSPIPLLKTGASAASGQSLAHQDSSTQVHVTNRDSLSSGINEIDPSNYVIRQDDQQEAINSSRHSSVTSECSVISNTESLELEFENPEYIEPNRKSEVSDFVEQITSLTDKIGREDLSTSLQSDHSSFTKDSLHSDSLHSSMVSEDNDGSITHYNFGTNNENVDDNDHKSRKTTTAEEMLPGIDNTVVLVKKKKIIPDYDSFYNDSASNSFVESNNTTTTTKTSPNSKLAESQDSGIGMLTKLPKDFNHDSEDIIINPDYHAGLSTTSSQYERLKSDDETSYPHEYTTLLKDDSFVDSPRSVGSSGSGGGGGGGRGGVNDENADKYSVDSLDILDTPASDSGFSGGSSLERGENDSNTAHPHHKTMSVTEEISIDQSQVMYVTPEVSKPPITDNSVNDSSPSTVIQNESDGRETFIIEKPKLSYAISNAMKVEEKGGRSVRPMSIVTESNSSDPDLQKLMSYVESAKQKSGEIEVVPLSPGSDTKTAFFVDLSDEKKGASGSGGKSRLTSRSLENFSSSSSKMSSVDYSNIDLERRYDLAPSPAKQQPQQTMTVTALGTKPESRPARGFTLRDSYHKPVSSLREAYGKPVNRDAEFNFSNIKSTTTQGNATPAYSFYKTETRTESPSGRKANKDVENKRHSTVIMTAKDDKSVVSGAGGNSRRPRSEYFMGPRPWGARQASEPSVRDVRKALEIHEQRLEPMGGKHIQEEAYTADGELREQINKLGFSPRSEHESDQYVLEDKSISQINLPAERRSVMKARQQLQPRYGELSILKSESMENMASPYSPTGNKMTKSSDNVFESSTAQSAARDKSKKSLQSQYDDLQQQFSKWQEQLMDNQALLSRRATNREEIVASLKSGQISNLKVSDSSDAKFTRRGTANTTANSQENTSGNTHRSLTQVPSLETSTVKTEPRKHHTQRYNSLTEGVSVMPSNGALGGRFSTDELNQARNKLRQNSTEEKKSGTKVFAGVQVTTKSYAGSEANSGSKNYAGTVINTTYAGSDISKTPSSYAGTDISSKSYAGTDVSQKKYAGVDVSNKTYAGVDVGNKTYAGVDVGNKTYAGVDVSNKTYAGVDVSNKTYAGTSEPSSSRFAGVVIGKDNDASTRTTYAGTNVSNTYAGIDVNVPIFAGEDVSKLPASPNQKYAGVDVSSKYAGSLASPNYAGSQVGSKFVGSEITSKFAGSEVSPQKYAGSEVISKFAGSEVTSKYAGSEVSSKYAGSEVTSIFAGSEVTPKYAGSEVSPQKYAGSQVSSKFAGSEVTSKFAGSEVTSKYAGSEVSSKYAGSEVSPQKYAGSEVTKNKFASSEVSSKYAGSEASPKKYGSEVTQSYSSPNKSSEKTEISGIKTTYAGADKTSSPASDGVRKQQPRLGYTGRSSSTSSDQSTKIDLSPKHSGGGHVPAPPPLSFTGAGVNKGGASSPPSSPTGAGVSQGYHPRTQTTKYGAQPGRKKGQQSSKSRFEPVLDPREELMMAIRNAASTGLRKVVTNEPVLKPITTLQL